MLMSGRVSTQDISSKSLEPVITQPVTSRQCFRILYVSLNADQRGCLYVQAVANIVKAFLTLEK